MFQHFRRIASRFAACAILLAAGACSNANPQLAPAALKGERPDYGGSRAISSFSNEQAVVRGIWMPGLSDGYVPQGVAFAEGHVLVSAYGGEDSEDEGTGTCRVFRIDPASGEVAGYFDLPKEIKHAGGLAYDNTGTVYVADTRILLAVDLAASLAKADHTAAVRGLAKLAKGLRGSFIAFGGKALWVGRFNESGGGELSQIDPALVVGGRTLGQSDVSRSIPIAAFSQGADFDLGGRLWLSQSNSKFGQLQQVDPATGRVVNTFRFAPAVEDLAFGPDGLLYTVSEAGAQRYQKWAAFHPLVMAVDVAKLK